MAKEKTIQKIQNSKNFEGTGVKVRRRREFSELDKELLQKRLPFL